MLPFSYIESFTRIVIGVDPAITFTEDSDETGIIIAGKALTQEIYVLEDLSCQGSPTFWMQRIIEAYYLYKADRIVSETNQGGDLVETLLRSLDPYISFKAVHATRGKKARAEPIAALYEQGKIFHLKPFVKLEEQLCSYVPGKTKKSPDRMDALVWALTELCFNSSYRSDLRLTVI